MRHALLIACAALALVACGDDDGGDRHHDHDSGPKVDGGSPDAGPPARLKLERPSLPRPPIDGLPADLRPPR